jgi:hypothetical protein
MTEQKIEQFWRDATAGDTTSGKRLAARFRDYPNGGWADNRTLAGWRRIAGEPSLLFYDEAGVAWFQCQVYEPQQWWLDKPDPGPGYRLLEKFPAEDLQPGDEWFEHDPLEAGWKVSHNERQAKFLWYRRRIEPNAPEKLDGCVDHLEVGKEYRLPNGQGIKVTKKGFELE